MILGHLISVYPEGINEMLLVRYKNTHVRRMSISIVPAKVHELRLDRFTISKVGGVMDQLLMSETTAY